MNVAIAYVYPMAQLATYHSMARRFTSTFRQFPPDGSFKLYVIVNGQILTHSDKSPFIGIPCEFIAHDNSGWDIGAFQMLAEKVPSDLTIFMGSKVHFHKPGWFSKMVDSYLNNGPGLFGCWGYQYPNPHIRTTCFWCPNEVLNSYPNHVGSTQKARYAFEHGKISLTAHVIALALPCMMVTRKGEFDQSNWKDNVPIAEESLVLDQHTHL